MRHKATYKAAFSSLLQRNDQSTSLLKIFQYLKCAFMFMDFILPKEFN